MEVPEDAPSRWFQREPESGVALHSRRVLVQKHADKIRFRHPCIVDQLCVGCPEGARCDGQTPYAVPLPGYCKVEGKECFLKCKKPSHCKGKHARCSPQQDGYSECQ